jgi:anti-sigma-K factor RskA
MNDSSQHNDFESLCSGYVLNALSDEERREFEEMLESATPEQMKLLHELQSVKDDLALLPDPVSPSDSLEERIFSNIDGDESEKGAKISRMGLPGWVYKVAAALLLISTLAVSFYMQNLSDTVQQQQATITQLMDDLDRKEQLLDVIAAREVKLVVMGGLDPSPDGYGKILWDTENQQAVLQLANIPAPPADKDYQLWLIKDDQSPISAGVFNFEESSDELFFKVEQLNESPSPEQNVFAVTLEPKGGVPQPTGSMFLLGQQ